MRIACAMALAASMLTAAAAGPSEISLPAARVFPESITVAHGRDLIVSSVGDGTIWRARPGDTVARPWIKPVTSGLVSMLGVYADDRAGLLWVCSLPRRSDPAEIKDQAAAVRTFDLATGAPVGRYPLPDGAKSTCNDFAIAPDGTAYIAETSGGRVLRLRKGAPALEPWITSTELAGVDGIALDDGGVLYLSSVSTGRMFKATVASDGLAGPLVELTPPRKLSHPDGLRRIGRGCFLISENGDDGGISILTAHGTALDLTPVAGSRPGTTSAVSLHGQAWGVVAKLKYFAGPMAGQDPGAFSIYAVPLRGAPASCRIG